MALLNERPQSTLRRWGLTPDQTFRSLSENNRYVFRLQAAKHVHATNSEPRDLTASAYEGKLFLKAELLEKRTTLAENMENHIDEVIRHVDMWTPSSDSSCSTYFVSATFSLTWVFWEAARRSRMADRERRFSLIVIDSASLRDAGAMLGNEILSKHKHKEKLQLFTNSCQEVLVPVIIMSKEIINIVEIPLPDGFSIPSWIATTLSSGEAEIQPPESVSSTEDDAEESMSSSERPSEDKAQTADSNPKSFRKFCEKCASAYAEVIDQDKEAQAKALAFEILCDQNELRCLQSGSRGDIPQQKLEEIAALAIEIWRWPTRLGEGEEWWEWHGKQAALEWPGKEARLLSSLLDLQGVDKLSADGQTSTEQSVSVPSPMKSNRKRKISIIESDDLGSNPAQQDERDSKRARPTR